MRLKCFSEVLPDDIINRPKNPYRAPIKQSLLNHKTTEYTQEALSQSSIEKAGLFDASRVARLMQKIQAASRPSEMEDMALAGILSSQIIHRQFVQDFRAGGAESVSPDLVVDRRSQALRSVS